MRPTKPLTILSAALAVSAIGAAAPPGASAATTVATADYGQASVSLVKDGAQKGRYLLQYAASQTREPVPVAVKLPAGMGRYPSVGLGLDATGLLTAVVDGPKGIYWTHVTRPNGMRLISRTKGGTDPAIYRGRVAYLCSAEGRQAVCRASLRTKARRVLYREPKGSQWGLSGVLIGPKSTLAIHAYRDGALGADRIQIKRLTGKPKTIADANLDSGEDLRPLSLSPDGEYLQVVRSDYREDETKEQLELYRFPSGKRAS